MSAPTLTVSELLNRLAAAVADAAPLPLWVQGEASEYRRTSRGAVFFRMVDPDSPDHSIEVAGSGRLMMDVERQLDAAGVGTLRAGIQVRVKASVGLRPGRSLIQLSLLEVDPAFTAGRLALDRDEVLRRLAADGSLAANARIELPPVPLRIGLVTSRGSAAHADFIEHLRRPGYRFTVRTVQASMQGEAALADVTRALARLSSEPLDLVALVRGGGSKIDLAPFDTEEVGRAIATMPLPVITGIGHETDRSVADEAAAIAMKTPTAAAEWIVARVADFERRVETARRTIADAAGLALARSEARLDQAAAQLAEVRSALARQGDLLDHTASSIVVAAGAALERHRTMVSSLAETIAAIGVEPTLRRGFAILTSRDGAVIRSVGAVVPGDRVQARLSDGTLHMTVDSR
jgi:exodeoxyribonuclease VII large subunit